MINKVILIGNVGKDPEVKQIDSGSSVGRFSVATNESYKDKAGEWQNLTEWHNIVVWRQLAERAAKSLKKGMSVYIEGKLSTRKWKDKEGNEKFTTEVIAHTFRILEKKNDQSNGATKDLSQAPVRASEVEDDLPF